MAVLMFPALTPAGFVQWVNTLIQAEPDKEFDRLSKTLIGLPLLDLRGIDYNTHWIIDWQQNDLRGIPRISFSLDRASFPAKPDDNVLTYLAETLEEHASIGTGFFSSYVVLHITRRINKLREYEGEKDKRAMAKKTKRNKLHRSSGRKEDMTNSGGMKKILERFSTKFSEGQWTSQEVCANIQSRNLYLYPLPTAQYASLGFNLPVFEAAETVNPPSQ